VASASAAPATVLASAMGQSRYGGVASALRERIHAGEWAPGEAIHAEAALAQSYGVAVGTIRQALSLLVKDGMLERRHGKGTFVSPGLSGASMLRFFRFRATGAPSEPPLSQILSRRLRRVDAAEAAAFGSAPDAQVLQLERVRSIAGEPCLLESIVLPLPLFAPLVDSDPADWGNLLYPAYQQQCRVLIHQAEDHLSFAQLTATQARRLGLQAGHPCVVVRRTARDLGGRCMELRITRGDAFAFEYTAQVR
jgi:GntR family transcriptional regulator